MRKLAISELNQISAASDAYQELFIEGAITGCIFGVLFHTIHASSHTFRYSAVWAAGGGLLNILMNVE